MGSKLLDEFILYAKEKYEYDIKLRERSVPDPFESIFGIDFSEQQKNSFYFPECDVEKFEYENKEIEVTIDFRGIIAESDFIKGIELAA